MRLAFMVLALLTPVQASPCDCTPKRPVAVEFAAADAVFVGTLQAEAILEPTKRHPNGKMNLIFEVEAGYKNVTRKSVTMFNRSRSTCALRFRQGQSYLIYAFKTTKGELHTHVCSRTAGIDDAIDDIEALGEPEYLKEEYR